MDPSITSKVAIPSASSDPNSVAGRVPPKSAEPVKRRAPIACRRSVQSALGRGGRAGCHCPAQAFWPDIDMRNSQMPSYAKQMHP
jgi:hypothetical protein